MAARKSKKNDGDSLTTKQEAFALAYFETGKGAEAYRRAYDVEPAAMDSWIYVEASQLLDNPKIAKRIEELQAEAAKLSIFTVSAAHDQYEEARVLALSEKNPSAAVSAVTGKVKLFGLEAPTRVHKQISGPNGGPIQTEEVSARDILADRVASLAARTGKGSGSKESDGSTD